MINAADGTIPSMEYGLTRLVLEEETFVEITPEYYHSALEARSKLAIVLTVEEKLTLILENYLEFENELLSAVQNELVFGSHDWSEFMSQLNTFNRRLMNLLTAARTYLYHIEHDLNALYGSESAQGKSITEQTNRQYETLLGYRVMEAVRNYIQHRALPIFGAEHWGSWNVDPSRRTTVNVVTPYLSVEKLREDGKFKKSVLSELEKLGNKIDIKHHVREYMEGIGQVHHHFRDTVAADVERWDQIIIDSIDRYKAVGGQKVVGLALVSRQAGEIVESRTISQNSIDRRKWLQRRTRNVTHYTKHTVSSSVKEHLTSPKPDSTHD